MSATWKSLLGAITILCLLGGVYMLKAAQMAEEGGATRATAAAGGERYLSVDLYGEQQTNALAAFCKAILFAKKSNRTLIEPFSAGSYLSGPRPAGGIPNQRVPLSDVYNQTAIEQLCQRNGGRCLLPAQLPPPALSRENSGRSLAKIANHLCLAPWQRPARDLGPCWRDWDDVAAGPAGRLLLSDAPHVSFELFHNWVLPDDAFVAEDVHCATSAFAYADRYYRQLDILLMQQGIHHHRYIATQMRTQVWTENTAEARTLASKVRTLLLQIAHLIRPHYHLVLAVDLFSGGSHDYMWTEATHIYHKMFRELADEENDIVVLPSENPADSRIIDHLAGEQAALFLSFSEISRGSYHFWIIHRREMLGHKTLSLSVDTDPSQLKSLLHQQGLFFLFNSTSSQSNHLK